MSVLFFGFCFPSGFSESVLLAFLACLAGVLSGNACWCWRWGRGSQEEGDCLWDLPEAWAGGKEDCSCSVGVLGTSLRIGSGRAKSGEYSSLSGPEFRHF